MLGSTRVVTLSILLASSFASVAFADGKTGPCTIATKGDSPTAKACAKGGRKDATALMKKMVADAKAKGQKFTCDGCHKDMDNYTLTNNANADYKKLEAAVAVASK